MRLVKPASWRADSRRVGLFDQLGGLPFIGRAQKPRAAKRYRTEATRCGLGELADVSITGCRVRCDGAPVLVKGQRLPLRVQSGSSALSLNAAVAWVRKGGKGWELGLRFIGVGAAEAQVLRHLCEYGFLPAVGRAQPCATKASAGQAAGVSGAGSGAAPPPGARVEIEDLYAVLEVARNADIETIRRAYHRMAQRLHPDHNTGIGTAERFALVSKAYSVLRDAGNRARYDAMLDGHRRAA